MNNKTRFHQVFFHYIHFATISAGVVSDYYNKCKDACMHKI